MIFFLFFRKLLAKKNYRSSPASGQILRTRLVVRQRSRRDEKKRKPNEFEEMSSSKKPI